MVAVTNKRSFAIDLLKCIATLAIFNHQSGALYTHWPFLASGGAIGISLFFFSSGYTLTKGSLARFDNWYKRRLSRVWPTVFIVVALNRFLGRSDGNILSAFIGGGWFVRDILIAYALFYVVRYFKLSLYLIAGLNVVFLIVWYCFFFPYESGYAFFSLDSIRAIYLFLMMLLGGIFAERSKEYHTIYAWVTLIVLALGLILFNLFVWLLVKGIIPPVYQILVLVPLIVLCLSLFSLCRLCENSKIFESIMMRNIVLLIGGLCLELYFTCQIAQIRSLNFLFPVNVPLNLLFALTFSYFVRSLSRWFAQSMQVGQPYDWGAIFRIV